MISIGRFILQNESLKRVYFLIVSYGKIWKVRTFFFQGKCEISVKLSVRRSIVFTMKNKKALLPVCFWHLLFPPDLFTA